MKKFPILSAFLCVLVTLTLSCKKEESPVIYSGFSQGTTFNILFFYKGDTALIISEIDSVLKLMDSTASLWDSSSIISKINKNEPVEITALFRRLFERSMEISNESGGAFDCTVGPLVRAWGFYRKQGSEPPASTVDSLRTLIGYSKIRLEGDYIVKNAPGIQIDFNAIAQGMTVDMIAELFHQEKISNYLIELGGEVRTSGFRKEQEPWKIGIEKPSANDSSAQEVGFTVALSNKSISTSGNYRKYFIRDGRKFSHTIDPFTGFPVSHSLLSVSVIAPDCATADAYATVCMVLGLEKGEKFLESRKDVEGLFIFTDEKGAFQVRYTSGFGNYLQNKQ